MASYKELREVAIAYGKATPVFKAFIRAILLCNAGLFWLIIPDILSVFNVNIPVWKNGTLCFFGASFFGVGLGQLILSILYSPQNKSGKWNTEAKQER